MPRSTRRRCWHCSLFLERFPGGVHSHCMPGHQVWSHISGSTSLSVSICQYEQIRPANIRHSSAVHLYLPRQQAHRNTYLLERDRRSRSNARPDVSKSRRLRWELSKHNVREKQEPNNFEEKHFQFPQRKHTANQQRDLRDRLYNRRIEH